ncbi:hypothetical protein [Streptomyces sp. NPDC054854]
MTLEDRLREAADAVNGMWTDRQSTQERHWWVEARLLPAWMCDVLRQGAEPRQALTAMAERIHNVELPEAPSVDLLDELNETLLDELVDVTAEFGGDEAVCTLARYFGGAPRTVNPGLMLVLGSMRLAGAEQTASVLAKQFVRRADVTAPGNVLILLRTLRLTAQHQAIATLVARDLAVHTTSPGDQLLLDLAQELWLVGARNEARALQALHDSETASDPWTPRGQPVAESSQHRSDEQESA